jgi:hypothetical protein
MRSERECMTYPHPDLLTGQKSAYSLPLAFSEVVKEWDELFRLYRAEPGRPKAHRDPEKWARLDLPLLLAKLNLGQAVKLGPYVQPQSHTLEKIVDYTLLRACSTNPNSKWMEVYWI